ncbi:MAG: carboxypeptidase regulatory-like domain-containing protein [Gemmatimonas sp.]
MSHSPSLVDGRRPVLLPRVVVAPLLLVACLWPLVTAKGQEAAGSLVRGQVQLANGNAAPPTTISLLDTQEQTTTDSLGRFALRTMHRGVATLVARRVGFVPATVDIDIPCDTALRLTLVPMPPSLAAMTVVAAGEYTLGSGRTASLTPLEVAQTPGAAANVAKALQTLPGPQNVDEGSGLFVRGGDVTETRVLLDDAWLLSPARFDNPVGHVTATVNPFLLDRTIFSAGAVRQRALRHGAHGNRGTAAHVDRQRDRFDWRRRHCGGAGTASTHWRTRQCQHPGPGAAHCGVWRVATVCAAAGRWRRERDRRVAKWQGGPNSSVRIARCVPLWRRQRRRTNRCCV